MVKEHACNKCIYGHFHESEYPCCFCKYRFDQGTTERLNAKDYFKPKEKEHSSNCTISDKECNKAFKNEDYGFEEISKDEVDMVNHPQHYSAHGIEPIDYIESHGFNFNLGNVIKYVSRAPYKGTELEDLKKAKWYLEREINKHGQ